MSSVFSYDLRADRPVAVSGSGSWITDSAGQRWLDGTAGAGAVTLGYGRAEIAEAMLAQAGGIAFAYSRHFAMEVQEELAAFVVKLAPPQMELVYFTSGGSEANESAVKMARQYHLEAGTATKYLTLSRRPGYHGNTLAMLSLSGRPDWQHPYRPMLAEGAQVLAPYGRWRRDPGESDRELAVRCAADLEEQILRIGPEYVAALIAEPIIGGTAPAACPADEYWPLVRQICDRHDVLLIADEVLTGFGRTGQVFAVNHWDLIPDLITCGKGISSGYAPLGAVIVRDRVAQAFRAGSGQLRHSFTYSGHAVSVAAGLGAVKYLTDNGCVTRSASSGTRLHARLADLGDLECVAELRGGRGMLIGIEFGRDRAPGPRAQSALAAEVVRYARERHVLLSVAADGDQLQIMPPLTSTDGDLEQIADVVSAGVRNAAYGNQRQAS
jgi:adenosylmethionine-8-amino-7-oxononanoate aminotransferase